MNIKLPKKFIEIKNADKTFTEKWNPSRSSDISNFPHPSQICLIGPQSTGKSFVNKHLILHQRPMFKEVYIIHGDKDGTKEYDDIEPTLMMDEFPPIEFWDGKVKTLCIIDDLEFSNLSKLQVARMHKLIRYGSSHKNITLYFSHQNFFELPGIIRKLSNVFIIWKPRSTTELSLISNRVGMQAKELSYIFDNICNQYRDSLCIDLNNNTPAYIRKNLWDTLDIEDIRNKIKVKEFEDKKDKSKKNIKLEINEFDD
jgi:hypothetical protein